MFAAILKGDPNLNLAVFVQKKTIAAQNLYEAQEEVLLNLSIPNVKLTSGFKKMNYSEGKAKD